MGAYNQQVLVGAYQTGWSDPRSIWGGPASLFNSSQSQMSQADMSNAYQSTPEAWWR